jgi:hypothetical protein
VSNDLPTGSDEERATPIPKTPRKNSGRYTAHAITTENTVQIATDQRRIRARSIFVPR